MYARAFIHKTTGRYLHTLKSNGECSTVGKAEYGKLWKHDDRYHEAYYKRFCKLQLEKLQWLGFQEVVIEIDEELWLQARVEAKEEANFMKGYKYDL